MKKIFLGLVATLLILCTACIQVVVPNENGSSSGALSGQQPVAYIDVVTPASINVGDMMTFDGHGTDADGTVVGYEWRSSIDGILSTAPSFTSTSLSDGTHTIYLRVVDNTNLWSPEVSTNVTVNPKAAKPVIVSFVASPNSVAFGDSFELSWNVTGASTVTIDNGVGQVPGTGAMELYPSTSIVFTLTASNDSGSVTATASVTVPQSGATGNPVINFEAAWLGGTSWQLNWNVTNSTEQVIEPEIGPVGPTGSVVVTVPSGQSKVYKLTAKNPGGWVAYHQVHLTSP